MVGWAGPADQLFDNVIYENNVWETNNDTYSNTTGLVTTTSKIIGRDGTNYNGEFVKARFNKAYILTKYEFYHRSPTPNSFASAFLPKKWFILGSNDGITWDLVHSMNSYTSYTANQAAVFNVNNNTTAYSNYALVVNQIVGDTIKLNIG